MANYFWNPRRLGGVFLLPEEVADRLLTVATPEQLRVLVWFSRHGQAWDAAACAADLQLTAQECEGCLRFWAEQGILTEAETAAEPAPAEKKPAPRTAAVKPVWQEVLAYQQEHREFSAFLQEVSARLGRTLNHGDNATLLYLITTAGLSQASVMMMVGYAVSVGKATIRYVENLALSWVDQDIVTPEQVDQKIRQLQQAAESAAKVEKLLLLSRPLTTAQAIMADTWLHSWGFSDEMLARAHAITMENCEKFSAAYMNRILERWHAEGIDRPDRIPAPISKKRGPAATNPAESSLDAQEFEEQLLKYRPKFNKDKG